MEISPDTVGYIIMEDLSDDFSLVDVNKGLNQSQVEQLVDALAEFNVRCFPNISFWSSKRL